MTWHVWRFQIYAMENTSGWLYIGRGSLQWALLQARDFGDPNGVFIRPAS